MDLFDSHGDADRLSGQGGVAGGRCGISRVGSGAGMVGIRYRRTGVGGGVERLQLPAVARCRVGSRIGNGNARAVGASEGLI